MNGFATALAAALWGSALIWSAAAVIWLASWRSVRPLPGSEGSRPGESDAGGAPRVTVALAARDEAARIEATIERLLDQRGVELDVSVADDRSDDATPRLLEALSRRHGARLRVARIDAVPDGWVAKNHALAVAARGAAGDWLLFTDADAWMDPRTVADAVGAARRAGAAHLCLIPGDEPGGARGRAALLHFTTQGVGAAGLVHAGVPRAHIGVGAFNLVRRDLYLATGGHAAFASAILDDLELGRAVAARGTRTRIHDGRARVRVTWAGGGARGLVRATEKNFFALFGYRTALAAGTAGAGLTVWALPVIGAALALLGGLEALGVPAAPGVSGAFAPGGVPVALAWAGGAAAAAVLTAALAHLPGAWRPGGEPTRVRALLAALLAPAIGPPVLAAAILRSTFRTLRDGGVRWRDTFYPLDFLRRGAQR